MSYTPFNAPLLAGLFGDREVAAKFSVQADITAMLRFEAALALAQVKADIIPPEAAYVIAEACKSFEPDVAALGQATPRDGLVVPELIRQLKASIGEPHNQYLHFGSTSQDVIDTSLILRLVDVISILEKRLDASCQHLRELSAKFGKRDLMGRTRMQAALPILVSDRINIWVSPLEAHKARLAELKPRLLKVQCSGAVGTLDKLGDKGELVKQNLAETLELNMTHSSWHTDRSEISDFAHWMALVTGSLGKMGQDISLMAQQGIGETSLSGGGTSSAMPHKQNPIKAEALMTLARFNAVQSSGLYQIHEQERSGSAWSLEWMLLPQICVATGASLRVANELLASVKEIGTA